MSSSTGNFSLAILGVYIGDALGGLPIPLLIPLLLLPTVTSLEHDILLSPPREPCYSCASFTYLPRWSELMHHYFPPKNFSDRCWQPDPDIGTVPCQSACFTLVENVASVDNFIPEQQAVMRGCVDRLLLFGLDEDVRSRLSDMNRRQTQCRLTDRKILRLYPLSAETQPVFLCSCVGGLCNDGDMLGALRSSRKESYLLSIFITLLISLCVL